MRLAIDRRSIRVERTRRALSADLQSAAPPRSDEVASRSERRIVSAAVLVVDAIRELRASKCLYIHVSMAHAPRKGRCTRSTEKCSSSISTMYRKVFFEYKYNVPKSEQHELAPYSTGTRKPRKVDLLQVPDVPESALNRNRILPPGTQIRD